MLLTWSHLWPALTPFFIPFLIHSHNCVWMAAEIDVFTPFTKRRRHSFSLMSPLWPPSTESECFTACSGGLYWTLGDGYNWLPGMIQSVFILQRELSLNSFTSFKYLYGLPRCLRGKESACQCRSCWRSRFNPWVGEIPWSRKQQPTLVFLPEKSHGQRSLLGYRPWGCKVRHNWAYMHWIFPLESENFRHCRNIIQIPHNEGLFRDTLREKHRGSAVMSKSSSCSQEGSRLAEQ